MPRPPAPLRPSAVLVAAVLLGPLLLAACRRDAPPAAPPAAPAPSDTVRYAEGFRLRTEGGARVAEVRQGDRVSRFVLVGPGAAPPAGVAGTVVRVPVRRVVALSTTHLGFLAALGATDAVAGVSGKGWVNTPAVLARLAAGTAHDVGEPGAVDPEAVAAARPDVVLAEEAAVTTPRLAGVGAPVVPVLDYLEPTPLGRAEWLVFVGALVGREAEARARFDSVAARYERLAARARATSPQPTVLFNAPYRGVWYVPGGRSFLAALGADAGGAYPWGADTARTSLPLSFEQVLAKAQGTDVWLHVQAPTRAALAGQDARLRLFRPFGTGRVYSHDARVSPGGGYDYFETGAVEPDVVLADLVALLHPALLPGHRLTYYRRVP